MATANKTKECSILFPQEVRINEFNNKRKLSSCRWPSFINKASTREIYAARYVTRPHKNSPGLSFVETFDILFR